MADAERRQQRQKPGAGRNQGDGHDEQDAASQYQRPPVPDIAQDTDRRLQHMAHNGRDCEQHTYLRIRQTQVRANQGPSRLTGAVYELIEQRDR